MMKIPNFKGDNIYRYDIVFADNGKITINVEKSGDIINYDVNYGGKLVKNYTAVYTGIPDNEVQRDIYKATGGVFDWIKIDDGLMLDGASKHGYHYEIKSNLTGAEVIYNNLPVMEVTAKAPAKNGTNKKMLVVGLLVVVCVLAVMAAKPIKRKR